MILGLYDHPSTDPNIQNHGVEKNDATWFLYQTEKQAAKWLIWSRKVFPVPIP